MACEVLIRNTLHKIRRLSNVLKLHGCEPFRKRWKPFQRHLPVSCLQLLSILYCTHKKKHYNSTIIIEPGTDIPPHYQVDPTRLPLDGMLVSPRGIPSISSAGTHLYSRPPRLPLLFGANYLIVNYFWDFR